MKCAFLFPYLARVLASLEVAGAEHVGGDLSGVGVPASDVTQDRDVQAPQLVGVEGCKDRRALLVSYDLVAAEKV